MQTTRTLSILGRIQFLSLVGLVLFPVLSLNSQETFTDPILVTDGSGGASQSRIAIAPGRVYIISTVGSNIAVRLFSSTSEFETTLPSEGLGQGDPSVQSTLSGGVQIAYTQEGEVHGSEGREVHLITSFGQTFSDSSNLSQHPADDYAPILTKDSFGEPVIFWTRSEDSNHEIIRFNPLTEQTTSVAGGQFPSAIVGIDGVTHLIYSRDRDLYYKNDRSTNLEEAEEVRVVSTPNVSEYNVSIGLGTSGEVLVAFESAGSLFISLLNNEGRFGNPFELVSGGASDPQLLQESNGKIFLAYTLSGDIYYSDLTNLVAPKPIRVTHTPDSVETRPDMRLDIHGDLHLSYYLDGEVYYVTNSSKPEVSFEADHVTGEQPLHVQFSDTTQGQVEVWLWDFGDGTTSEEQNPQHVYEAPGAYTVSLSVIGPGGQSELVMEEYITVQNPSNLMWTPDMEVFPQQENVWIPVIGSFVEPVGAISIAGYFDTNLITLNEITLTSTYSLTASPELFITNISNEGAEGFFTVAMLVDFPDTGGEDGAGNGEFEGRVLPPGDRRRLVNLICDLNSQTAFEESAQIRLANTVGPTRISCTYTIGTASQFPVLTSGQIKFLDIFNPEPTFVRSDVDLNGSRDISDAISLLDYLFLGNFQLKCPDAADYDDSGLVDLSDAIAILAFQFLGDRTPAIPFPTEGADPTEDNLPECEL